MKTNMKARARNAGYAAGLYPEESGRKRWIHQRVQSATVVFVLGGILCLHVTALDALSVTQAFLDQECRKTDIRVVGNDPAIGGRPAKVIIGYNCSEIGQSAEYEALHFVCPYRGPKPIAAAVYDVQGQTYLRDLEEAGNFRSVVNADEIPTPSCDLPL